ncbi:hypothetical protein [Phytopseudomonas daroniae]|uniref:hypothetical protein n=1 Tax=Pseudomonadaceae TaxID=135621 RepID=UPI00103769A2|nr:MULTISPECIES: hypothetical protein [Pseudomonas]
MSLNQHCWIKPVGWMTLLSSTMNKPQFVGGMRLFSSTSRNPQWWMGEASSTLPRDYHREGQEIGARP